MSNEKTIRMPKELLDKWLAALRSGEYMQAGGRLRDPDTGGYCCLGVLVRVAGESDYSVEMAGGIPSSGFLFRNDIWFESRHIDGDSYPFLPSIGKDATTANDTGMPFAEIADAIELHAEGV